MADQFGPTSLLTLDRRSFIAAGLCLPAIHRDLAALTQAEWRTFEIEVRVDVREARGRVFVWLPAALSRPAPYQRLVAQSWTGNAQSVQLEHDASGASILLATWPASVDSPTLTLTMCVATTGYAVSLERKPAVSEGRERLDKYLAPTRLIPTDGIVRDTGLRIIRGHDAPLSRARAIYDWIVDNTFRDPAVKGCGLGDIRWMLESGALGGKCADLNALFVGLCRAVGLPARDLYGIRVGESAQFRSLGRSGDVTSAQHCRAEVFVQDIGWIPVDPADVRKLVLEERPGASLADADLRRARQGLFGAWEMNWIAFNDAHDVSLPGSSGAPIAFFMYPQAETDGVRKDSVDAPAFAYRITARERT